MSTTIRIILTIAISRDWDIKQLDVNNVFLNEVLQEEVFIENLEVLKSVEKNHWLANFTKPFMASNRPQEHGLKSLTLLYISLVSNLVGVIPLCLSELILTNAPMC